MSGGAGYVLSKEAMDRFVMQGITDNSPCKEGNEGIEDMELGYCMQVSSVIAGDVRDGNGRKRFFPMNVQDHITGDLPEWYDRYSAYPEKKVCPFINQSIRTSRF
jgi:glycoprotein-N-acetylgalactosamine 3-beta-galactosyltransferase